MPPPPLTPRVPECKATCCPPVTSCYYPAGCPIPVSIPVAYCPPIPPCVSPCPIPVPYCSQPGCPPPCPQPSCPPPCQPCWPATCPLISPCCGKYVCCPKMKCCYISRCKPKCQLPCCQPCCPTPNCCYPPSCPPCPPCPQPCGACCGTCQQNPCCCPSCSICGTNPCCCQPCGKCGSQKCPKMNCCTMNPCKKHRHAKPKKREKSDDDDEKGPSFNNCNFYFSEGPKPICKISYTPTCPPLSYTYSQGYEACCDPCQVGNVYKVGNICDAKNQNKADGSCDGSKDKGDDEGSHSHRKEDKTVQRKKEAGSGPPVEGPHTESDCGCCPTNPCGACPLCCPLSGECETKDKTDQGEKEHEKAHQRKGSDAPTEDAGCGCCPTNPCGACAMCCPPSVGGTHAKDGECDTGAGSKDDGSEDIAINTIRPPNTSTGTNTKTWKQTPPTTSTGTNAMSPPHSPRYSYDIEGNQQESWGKGGDDWRGDAYDNDPFRNYSPKDYRLIDGLDDVDDDGYYAEASKPPNPEREYAKANRRSPDTTEAVNNRDCYIPSCVFRPYWYADRERTTKSRGFTYDKCPDDNQNVQCGPIDDCSQCCCDDRPKLRAKKKKPKEFEEIRPPPKPSKTQWIRHPNKDRPDNLEYKQVFTGIVDDPDVPKSKPPSFPENDFISPVNDFAVIPNDFREEWNNFPKVGDDLPTPDGGLFDYEVGAMLKTNSEPLKPSKTVKDVKGKANLKSKKSCMTLLSQDPAEYRRHCCFNYDSERPNTLCFFSSQREKKLSELQQPYNFPWLQPACPIRETVTSLLKKLPQIHRKHRMPEFYDYCPTDHKRDINKHKLPTRPPSEELLSYYLAGFENRGAKRKNYHR